MYIHRHIDMHQCVIFSTLYLGPFSHRSDGGLDIWISTSDHVRLFWGWIPELGYIIRFEMSAVHHMYVCNCVYVYGPGQRPATLRNAIPTSNHPHWVAQPRGYTLHRIYLQRITAHKALYFKIVTIHQQLSRSFLLYSTYVLPTYHLCTTYMIPAGFTT